MNLSAGTRLGPYEITAPIGAGGMGEVYRARDTRLDRQVAIKLLPTELSENPEFKRRFEREAKTISRLQHPNVCTLHDIGSEAGTDFLVLEYLDGETLKQRLRRGRLPIPEVVDVGTQIASGLEAAHRRGLVHRDLKPSNVMLTQGGAKVLDFGLAKELVQLHSEVPLADAPTLARATEAGKILGTPAYMSPEQAGGLDVDRQTDVWAFGCCLFEMLTGRLAFPGRPLEALARVSEGEADWDALNSSNAALIHKLVRLCLAKARNDRLHDIADARVMLQQAGREEPGWVGPIAPSGRWRVAAIVLAVFLAITTGLLVRKSLPGALTTSGPQVRMIVDMPPGAHIPLSETAPFAFSPDGQRLAFVAAQDNSQQLHLRELERFRPVSIDDTEGATAPFFSPDGTRVAFHAGGELRVIALEGGEPLTLCRVSGPYVSAVWSRDGMIYFGSGTRTIQRVSETGGEIETVLTVSGERDALVVAPIELVRAETELLVWIGLAPWSNEIALLDLRSGDLETLLKGPRMELFEASYLPSASSSSGSLVYAAGGELFVAPLDLGRAGQNVRRRSMLEGLFPGRQLADFFALSRTGSLAFAEGRAEESLLWMDRRGEIVAEIITAGHLSWPRISPEGKRVAFVDASDPPDIFVWDLEQRTHTRLTFSGANLFPAWSPDGERVTFSSTRTAVWDLLESSAEGSDTPQLIGSASKDRSMRPMSWTEDGAHLVVEAFDHSNNATEILALAMDGSPAQVLVSTDHHTGEPALSPDGRWLAYDSNVTGRFEVYVQSLDLPGRPLRISDGGGWYPRWAANSRELFYRNEDGLMAAVLDLETGSLVGEATRLFPLARDWKPDYDVSPDGERFVLLRKETSGYPSHINVVLNWSSELSSLGAGRVP